MTRNEVLEQLTAGKVSVEEAAKLLEDLTPTVKVVATQFASSKEFLKAAAPVKLSGGGLAVALQPKLFSTGSYGWSSNGKLAITLPDGQAVRVQGSINLVVIGSKPESKAA